MPIFCWQILIPDFGRWCRALFLPLQYLVRPKLKWSRACHVINSKWSPASNVFQKMCDDLFDDQAPEEKTGELLWLKTSTSLQKVWKKIFQKSLNSAKVPHIRKEANVSPIFKKGDKSDPANYRPISRVSVCIGPNHLDHWTLDRSK